MTVGVNGNYKPNRSTILSRATTCYFLCNEVKFMNKINLKGVNAETVTSVFILLVALINATLQMFSINTLPIENEEVTNIVSTVFLIATALWNTWKNRNVTTISQEVQQIADAVRNGEILEDDVKNLISKIKTKK